MLIPPYPSLFSLLVDLLMTKEKSTATNTASQACTASIIGRTLTKKNSTTEKDENTTAASSVLYQGNKKSMGMKERIAKDENVAKSYVCSTHNQEIKKSTTSK